jgi:hypothetical protein
LFIIARVMPEKESAYLRGRSTGNDCVAMELPGRCSASARVNAWWRPIRQLVLPEDGVLDAIARNRKVWDAALAICVVSKTA